MSSAPSMYLSSLERKRKRSDNLREGLAEGTRQALGGVDMLARLQAALEEKNERKEAKSHGREIEAKNQARADERFSWEREDREVRKNEREEMRADAATDRLSAMRRAFDGVRTSVEADDQAEADAAEARGNKMSDALARISRSLDEGSFVSAPAQAADKVDREDLRQLVATARTKPGMISEAGWARLAPLGIVKPAATPPAPKVGRRSGASGVGQEAKPNATSPTSPKPSGTSLAGDPQGRELVTRAQKYQGAAMSLDNLERVFNAYNAASDLPATGPIAGRLRSIARALPGIPFYDVLPEKERADFLAAAAETSAQIFNLLRQDAPTGAEGEKIEPIEFSDNDTPEEIRAKLTQIRRLLDERKRQVRNTASALGYDEGQAAALIDAVPSGKIRVRRKADGKTGTMPAESFDAALYERL